MYERGEGGREREREKRGREEFGPVLNGNLERREENRRRERKSGERFILRTGERRKRAKERKEGERKTGIGIFFFFFGSFHSHDSKRIPVKFTRSGGIDGIFSGEQSRGEESECARLNHASPVDHNFGDHFEPR